MELYEKRNKYYLEVLRIIAIFFVMFNHSPAYRFYETVGGIQYWVSLVLSLMCKVAVPLFYMISGALLLGKNECMKDLFQKRILKCVLVLILFSLLYNLKMAIRGEGRSIVSFFVSLPCKPIFLPYWYLYAYLGFCLLLPLLRPLAQNMDRKTGKYLLLLHLLFRCLFPMMENLIGYKICNYLNISPVLQDVFFLPLLGYWIDKYILEKEFWNWKGIALNLSMLLVIILTHLSILNGYVKTGEYSEGLLITLVTIPTLLVFLDIKMLIRNEWLPICIKKILSFTGDKVFGIYLLEGFIGTNGRMDVIFRVVSPFLGFILAYVIEIICIFVIRIVLVTIMKKLPVFRLIL